MIFAIKTEVSDPQAKTFAFKAQKTMYGGKQIARGDTVFIFASENEGGQGLISRGVVTFAKAVPKKPGILRQTPRVSITVARTALCSLLPFLSCILPVERPLLAGLRCDAWTRYSPVSKRHPLLRVGCDHTLARRRSL